MFIQALICIKTVRWTFDLRIFFYPLFSLSRSSKVRSMRAPMHTNLTVSLKTNAHVLFRTMELQTCSSAGCCLKQSSGKKQHALNLKCRWRAAVDLRLKLFTMDAMKNYHYWTICAMLFFWKCTPGNGSETNLVANKLKISPDQNMGGNTPTENVLSVIFNDIFHYFLLYVSLWARQANALGRSPT